MPSRYYQDRLTQLQEQVAEALQKQNKVKLGDGYKDLLELIEEPREEEKDGRIIRTGPTYSDVDVLLAHYVTILKYIRAKV